MYRAKNYDLIGSGALRLNPERIHNRLPYLNEELLLVAQNSKPGKREANRVLVCLKSAQEEKLLIEGKRTYLEGGALFTFSENEKPLWISPLILDRNSVLLQVGCEDKKTEFLLKKGSYKKSELPNYFDLFKRAEYWGKDLFLERYGGEEHSYAKKCEQILFTQPYYARLIQEGTFLGWIDEQWQVISQDQISDLMPVAMVAFLNDKKVEIEVWDETGFFSEQYLIEKKTTKATFKKPEELLTALRRRTSSQISCFLEGRKQLLKKGDWLVKTESGWHKLKNREEIDAFTSQEIRGELLIFDEIKKEKNKSNTLFTLFDKTRTQVQTLSIPLNDVTEKKKSIKKNDGGKK